MKRFYVVGLIALSGMLAFASCGNKANKKEPKTTSNTAVPQKPVTDSLKVVRLTEVKGYFFKGKKLKKDDKPMAMILTKDDFKKNFHPAKTMDKASVTTIDFDNQKVMGVVYPQTSQVTDLKFGPATLTKDGVLRVKVIATKDSKKTTFKMVPSSVYTFNAKQNVKTVAFNIDGVVTRIDMTTPKVDAKADKKCDSKNVKKADTKKQSKKSNAKKTSKPTAKKMKKVDAKKTVKKVKKADTKKAEKSVDNSKK